MRTLIDEHRQAYGASRFAKSFRSPRLTAGVRRAAAQSGLAQRLRKERRCRPLQRRACRPAWQSREDHLLQHGRTLPVGPGQSPVQRAAPQPALASDFTYVLTWQGFVYSAFVIDVFTRRIVGRTSVARRKALTALGDGGLAFVGTRLSLLTTLRHLSFRLSL